jgi:lipoprotein NlpD
VAGKTIRGFGKNGGGEISRGIDIAGRMGEPIIAAASGKVSYVGSLKDYGDFVVVRHEAEYLSVYAHTSKILVKEGQSVTKGQKIAEVGSSGVNQTKLHFEIRHKSEPVDPVKLLPARQ